MQAKKKSGGIVQLIFAHVEKLLAVLIIALGGYLVYASMGVEGETRQVSELQSKVQQTRTAYQDSSWEDIPAENKHESLDAGSSAIELIPDDIYQVSRIGWDRAVVAPTIDRGDPEPPAQGLEGTAITGLMAFIDESVARERIRQQKIEEEKEKQRREKERNQPRDPLAGGGRGGRGAQDFGPRGMRDGNQKGLRPAPRVVEKGYVPQGDELIEEISCAVVLAKAPSLDQYNLYRDKLETARGYEPLRDVPSYMGYLVERAEVREGQAEEWQLVHLTDGLGRFKSPGVTEKQLETAMKDWAGFGQPIIDSRYEHLVLSTPLPPLVGQELGRAAVHSEARFKRRPTPNSLKKRKLIRSTNRTRPTAVTMISSLQRGEIRANAVWKVAEAARVALHLAVGDSAAAI